MKFNSIVMGGGLSGLTAAIALAEAKQRVALLSYGQSTLYMNSGSFELQGRNLDGPLVASPLEAIASLPAGHPYTKVADVAASAEQAKQLLARAGVQMQGEAATNHYRLTPVGAVRPAWLSLPETVVLNDAEKLPWQRIMLVSLEGFLDMPVEFVAAGLTKRGANVRVVTINTAELNEARRSATEMRATNVAKRLVSEAAIVSLARAIKQHVADAEVVLVPAVLGFTDDKAAKQLQAEVEVPVKFMATLPPSVPGARIASQLVRYFQSLGGIVLTGDKAVKTIVEGDKIASIATEKLQDEVLEAENYVLATGSFTSHGIESNYTGAWEPVVGADLAVVPESREQWSEWNAFESQPYMEIGVDTDEQLHVKRNGKTIANCYAAGSILAGNNRVKQGNAHGVDMFTALQVVSNIIGK